MYCLSDQQIDFILNDLHTHGITTESLKSDLLDHICIIIEQNLAADGDFQQFYSSVIRSFYRQELSEIEEETRLLLTYGHRWALSRNQFFLLLFTLLIGPFIGYDLLCTWMVSLSQNHIGNFYGELWSSSFVFALYPLLVFLILWLTPDRFDPLIPRKSVILIGIRPFIKILPPTGQPAASFAWLVPICSNLNEPRPPLPPPFPDI